jgi:hypothetical protein
MTQSSAKIEETEIISRVSGSKKKINWWLQQVLCNQNKKVDVNPVIKNRKQLHPSH